MDNDRRIIAYLFAALTVFVVGYFAVARPELLGTQAVLVVGALMTAILALLGVTQRKPDSKDVNDEVSKVVERTKSAPEHQRPDQDQTHSGDRGRSLRSLWPDLLYGRIQRQSRPAT